MESCDFTAVRIPKAFLIQGHILNGKTNTIDFSSQDWSPYHNFVDWNITLGSGNNLPIFYLCGIGVRDIL